MKIGQMIQNVLRRDKTRESYLHE